MFYSDDSIVFFFFFLQFINENKLFEVPSNIKYIRDKIYITLLIFRVIYR